jgi:hypothetical protein
MNVAIICVSRDPIDFETWVRTHRVALLWIFYDGDAVKQRRALEAHGDRFVLRPAPSVVGPAFVANQTRQVAAVNLALAEIPDGWRVVHIDDDELLHAFGRPWPEALRNLAPKTMYTIPNFEARVDDPMAASIFTCTRFETDPTQMRSYRNGKACTVRDGATRLLGPHLFAAKRATRMKGLVVLHFSCTTFSKWCQKYVDYGAGGLAFDVESTRARQRPLGTQIQFYRDMLMCGATREYKLLPPIKMDPPTEQPKPEETKIAFGIPAKPTTDTSDVNFPPILKPDEASRSDHSR